jgi:serine/threonine protein kinase
MNTSSIDYLINIDNIERDVTLLKYNKVDIYTAKWRKYQNVCVKQIDSNHKVDNELCVLSKCIHPKIVQFLGAGKKNNSTYIIFEYMDNGNLEDYISKVKLDKTDKIKLMLDITIGLHYLHNRTPEIVLHRDLKPANILINKHGEAKISDFGISKLINSEMSSKFSGHTGEMGTYMWMSPEVLKHEDYNYKSDIYGLGLIFYYIWTEIKPFCEYEMNTIQLMFAKFQNNVHVNVEDNEELNTLVNECCSYEKESRPESVNIIERLLTLI